MELHWLPNDLAKPEWVCAPGGYVMLDQPSFVFSAAPPAAVRGVFELINPGVSSDGCGRSTVVLLTRAESGSGRYVLNAHDVVGTVAHVMSYFPRFNWAVLNSLSQSVGQSALLNRSRVFVN